MNLFNDITMGVDTGFDTAPVESVESASVEKAGVLEILSYFGSAISIDTSKSSTGVCLWSGSDYTLIDIHLTEEHVPNDALSEVRMRNEYKKKLGALVRGKHFEFAVQEDVFGGLNFSTTRTLITLNTVFDELVLEGVCTVGEYIKMPNTQWKKYMRLITKISGCPEDKKEIRETLRHLEFDFLLENENLSEEEKKNIGFQDKCDATAMLCAMAIMKSQGVEKKKSKKLTMAKLNFFSIEDPIELDYIDDIVIENLPVKEVSLGRLDIDKRVLQVVNDVNEEDYEGAYMMKIPSYRLKHFKSKIEIPYYDSGFGYLVFYDKSLKKKVKEDLKSR